MPNMFWSWAAVPWEAGCNIHRDGTVEPLLHIGVIVGRYDQLGDILPPEPPGELVWLRTYIPTSLPAQASKVSVLLEA